MTKAHRVTIAVQRAGEKDWTILIISWSWKERCLTLSKVSTLFGNQSLCVCVCRCCFALVVSFWLSQEIISVFESRCSRLLKMSLFSFKWLKIENWRWNLINLTMSMENMASLANYEFKKSGLKKSSLHLSIRMSFFCLHQIIALLKYRQKLFRFLCD